ncbi:MAG: 30S ribosomal protein S16 [Myxococcales bacterium]|nr:30S ribosomal protein S16 [Myxococcales bacterium]
MAVTIRLARRGNTHRPFYHIVAADSRYARDGRYLEQLGHYNPASKELEVDVEAAKKWLAEGAQQSNTARALLKRAGAI